MTDTPQVGIVRKIRPYSGLVRDQARADAPDWSQAVKDVLAPERPSAIVVMLGTNDRLALRDRAPPGKKRDANAARAGRHDTCNPAGRRGGTTGRRQPPAAGGCQIIPFTNSISAFHEWHMPFANGRF